MLIKFNFIWVLIGNFIVAFGNVYVLSVPAKFSALWFAPNKVY